jgi:hypothetical protein
VSLFVNEKSTLGGAVTFITTLPEAVDGFVGEDESATLTKAYVKVPAIPVGADTVTLFPDVVETNKVVPPFMVYPKVYGVVPPLPVKVINGLLAF